MSGLESIGVASSAARTANAESRRTQLDQDSFLRLMIAQLQNQDPFKPLDPTEYVGQLAQFSAVSGLQAIQGSVGRLADSLRGSHVLDGATLVGRRVLADGSRVRLSAADGPEAPSARGTVQVPPGINNVTLTVRDSSGQLVRSVALDASAGLHEFTWDGSTNVGGRAPPGEYDIAVVGRFEGRSVALPTQVAARVTSVSIDSRSNTLTLHTDTLGELALAQVRRVM